MANNRKSIDALLAEVDKLLAELPKADKQKVEDPFVLSAEFQCFEKDYRKLQQGHNENALSVAVVALTKSGKSLH